MIAAVVIRIDLDQIVLKYSLFNVGFLQVHAFATELLQSRLLSMAPADRDAWTDFNVKYRRARKWALREEEIAKNTAKDVDTATKAEMESGFVPM